jgi:hypothetical protein
MMTTREIVEAFLTALERRDLEAAVALFADPIDRDIPGDVVRASWLGPRRTSRSPPVPASGWPCCIALRSRSTIQAVGSSCGERREQRCELVRAEQAGDDCRAPVVQRLEIEDLGARHHVVERIQPHGELARGRDRSTRRRSAA